MAEAKINESCIIGLPTCGYAFSSARMAFIAAPSDAEFALELDVLQTLLREKEYEAYVALQNVEPGKFAFCTKICSKIITSQFCIVLLNSSAHRERADVKIPNPNVHMEYGMMLSFKKHVIPLQREGDALAFNIRPLDTVIYTPPTFREKAERVIDAAILAAGTTARPTQPLASSATLLRYLPVVGLKLADVSAGDAATLYGFGKPLGYYLLDGDGIVYFGLFDTQPAKEIVFRLKLLLQALNQARKTVEQRWKLMDAKQVEHYTALWAKIRIEIMVGPEIDRSAVERRVKELTSGLDVVPSRLTTADEMEARIKAEYDAIGL
jgi:hypothetical protein